LAHNSSGLALQMVSCHLGSSMLKVSLGVLSCSAGLAPGSLVDDIAPPIHHSAEYAEPFRAWDQVGPAWQEITKKHLGSVKLPFLPCISYPNVTMSDGVPIYTMVVNPWPCSWKKKAVLVRSPYGPTSRDLALLFVLKNGYAAVMQDQRGTWASGGTFDVWHQSAQDGIDTMKWIADQPWSDGDIHTAGVSADGIATFTPILLPEVTNYVKGQWSIWTTPDGHDFSYPGGALRHDLVHGYMDAISPFTHGAATKKDLPEIKAHEAFGPYWYNLTICRNVTDFSEAPGCRYNNVKWPVINSVGWWDIFQNSQINSDKQLRIASDPSVRDKHVLIVEPLGHCSLSPFLGTATETTKVFRTQFNHATSVAGSLASEMWSGKASQPTRSRLGRLNLFVMSNFGGAAPGVGNFWTSLNEWPAVSYQSLYMQPGRLLGNTRASSAASVPYVYDPSLGAAGETPMYGGNNLPIVGSIKHCGSDEQTQRENRNDVIVFDSAVLTEDLPIVGSLRANIFVSSSANDTDFVVTVSDLGKDTSMLVRYGAVRMRWRESDSRMSSPLVPGKVYEVDIDLWHTAYIFPKGHRVRVAIASAASPYYSVNDNVGDPVSVPKADRKPIAATNAIHMGPQYPSKLLLPVVKMADIPENPNFHQDASSETLVV